MPVESFDAGGWLRSLAFAGVAVVAPIVCAAAYVCGRGPPTFARLLGGTANAAMRLAWALGLTLIALCLLAVQAALGLVFDPRYRDIPFAPLTAAVVPFLVLHSRLRAPAGSRAVAETVAAAVLVASAGYIVFNESFANWQALWFCAGTARARRHSGAGAGRARLRISTPAASAERSALCSTRPNAAAASASATSTIEGRNRLSRPRRARPRRTPW